MQAFIFADSPQFHWDSASSSFQIGVPFRSGVGFGALRAISNELVARYVRTRYTNKQRFVTGFVTPIREMLSHADCDAPQYDSLKQCIEWISQSYDGTEPFSYAEAFGIENPEFQAMVFGCIRVPEMIRELGHTRIATAGRPVRHKQFAKDGTFTGYREYDVIFETHRVNGSKIGVSEPIYAVRCWCTTTDEEHWLWIDDAWAEDPLEAIAHTFHIHENLVPHIVELKRQGDVLLVELTQDIEPAGAIVALDAATYFGLLTAQS